ncbi:hypothetical protein [Nocardia sp. NPDC056000]|uniref:hypothetical protein n=1 Tax=Nocardia sp. NPDC056000 TaxID=3345674 RepID=UPI0035D8A832
MQDSAATAWRNVLKDITATREAAESWRQTRYRFAHALALALAGPGKNGEPAISGSVLYAVWLEWGLLYVGQTNEAERRLRDLAIGESHHLANTFPPEIWNRVVVISWPQLPEAEILIQKFGREAVGLGLEHRIQADLQPLANASTRKRDGTWRSVDWSKSRSVGAQTGVQIDVLFAAVKKAWDDPSNSAVCRVIHPGDLL